MVETGRIVTELAESRQDVAVEMEKLRYFEITSLKNRKKDKLMAWTWNSALHWIYFDMLVTFLLYVVYLFSVLGLNNKELLISL